ncbi:MAG: Nif11-like leader peptide family RiPP precursor [Chloroflexota bacterium]
MSQVNAFNNHVQGNAALEAELNGVADMAAYLAIAKREGFAISAEDMEAFAAGQAEGQGAELSDSQLEQVSGGIFTRIPFYSWCWRRC